MSTSSTSKLPLVEASFPVNDDLERGQPANEVPAESNADGPKDGSRILVTWNGDDDPEDPKNWSAMRKWKAIFAMSSFSFLTPFSSTVVAPALPQIASDLSISEPALGQMVLSVYLLGFTFGPLVASPLSEIYGRIRVVQVWNLVYILFNASCGMARSKEAIIILRFFAGLAGSSTLGIGGGTLSDLFRAKDRGKAVAINSWALIASPLIGAVAGGFIAQNLTWHWTFYVASILSVVVQASGLVFLEETYPPLLLRRKKAKLEHETCKHIYYTEFDHLDGDRLEVLKRNVVRPVKLLATQPIVQMIALYNAYLYGNTYILYANYITLWTDRYHQSLQIAGLNYISIAIGATIATEVCALINDKIYAVLSKRNGGKGKPEFRVPIMIPATILLAVGMFWYGWSAEETLHWIMPNIGTSIFVVGGLVCTVSANAYVIDTYGKYSASAMAAASTIRSFAGFAFPLFAPSMYSTLGYGWSGSLVGFVALGFGLPMVLVLGKYGPLLRAKSPYAAEKAAHTPT